MDRPPLSGRYEPSEGGSRVKGSRDAEYTEYVQSRLPWLRRVAYLLCQDWQSADDLVQSAITRLYTHWGRYLANELDVAPYADYEAHGVTGLIIDAGETADVNGNTCTTKPGAGEGGVAHVQVDGLWWVLRTPTAAGTKTSQPPGLPGRDATACDPQPDNGLYAFADLKLDTTGAARTGGINAVLHRLSLLGADQAAWSSTPLAG
jgi:hypothetical protein